jgi:PAP2 superfamily
MLGRLWFASSRIANPVTQKWRYQMSILLINDLALQLVANDFSNGHIATNGGPTKTSRALAIIHLAAHDAYAKVTGLLNPQLVGLPNPMALGNDEMTGTAALLAAGIYAAQQLYPDDLATIAASAAQAQTVGADVNALAYGKLIADAWIDARNNDGSNQSQLDSMYSPDPGRHRPDPLSPNQMALGRKWGEVMPFVLKPAQSDGSFPDAPLEAPPDLTSSEYALAFDQVIDNGKNDITQRSSESREWATIGIFWGYDGANKLGTPPRLYNQVVRAVLKSEVLAHKDQIKILTAINVAMADAGIAAWHWKYRYDFWRPVLGVREAEAGWGPTGLGDGNNLRGRKGDPYWLPLGAPKSNPAVPNATASGSNFTPNFPAYPSGHATFGSAAFEAVATLLGKTPEDITINFVSDELNGITTDNLGVVRPRYEATFTLREAIEENKISRIYLGVHWLFDATGGEIVGKAVADKVVAAFV